jgi:hypothetical protein
MILTGENNVSRRKACRTATFSTTNLTWNDLGSNLGLRDERPANNCLSHDKINLLYAFFWVIDRCL